jgi:DNA sulfur modification protein DndD
LLREQEKIVGHSEELAKRQGEIDNELEHQGELKRAISNRLLELSGAEELQHLRDELEAQAKSIREQLNRAKDTLQRAISTRGYIVLLSEATDEFRGIVSDLRSRGELPTGIKRQFVQDLLSQERCICGAELTDGTHAHQLVQAWMDRAGIVDVEETAIRMGAQVDEIDKQSPEFWHEVDRQQANINQCRIELSRIETELEDIKKSLRNYPNEDISNLQKRLDETEEKFEN